MPFKKGQKGGPGRPKGQANKRTIWLLESLKEHNFDYEAALVNALKHGDYKMAEILVRMVPHVANAPKQDIDLGSVETLVINRYKSSDLPEKA